MLEIKSPLPTMEAMTADEIPEGPGWQYEPKWDGFRCLAFRDGNRVSLQSRSGLPLARYFPEMVEAVKALKAKRFVLDGELAIAVKGRLSFDTLLLRIHPAESRIRKLSAEYPALFIVFDLLADERGKSLLELPLSERRKRLEAFARKYLEPRSAIRLSPCSTHLTQAKKWLRSAGANLDGVVAKRLDSPYRGGERGMLKVKNERTADCVVGGFRYASRGKQVGSLLLGLYDAEGLLDHVGFCSGIKEDVRESLTKRLEAMKKPPGFTGSAPGGPSRWSTKRSTEWEPVDPQLVIEVSYDHFTGGRFRHGTGFRRWRPDKSPRQCTFKQIPSRGANLTLLTGK
jgi:ATP-dependent DNA ligase